MDPLSALSIAAAVVQFADFGVRLVKNAVELYQSGQKRQHVDLATVSQDLLALVGSIESKIKDKQNVAGDVFLRLASECASINHEFQAILEKLRARGTTKLALAVDSWVVALKQIGYTGDIDALARRLGEVRQQMNVALLYLLLDEAWKNGVELREFAQQQADMIATLDRIDSTTKKFSTEVIGLIDQWPSSNESETDEMIKYVLSARWKPGVYAKRTILNPNLLSDEPKMDTLFQSLFFDSISDREQSIPQRHAATFEWVFHEPKMSDADQPLWSNFPQWLKGDSPDIYWITGKPGAGKSTLIKFISQDARFEPLVREWAVGSQLLVARFFSWTAGANKLQKTQQGLFRTILLDLIQQRPQLAVDIFPARWFLLQSFGGNIKLPEPELDELTSGFRNLLAATGKTLRVFLLIDGLDEFDDDHDKDHRQLLSLLREANALPAVKICTSSRPWNVFKDEFSSNPMLQLEKLTRQDIKLFVQERLESSPGYHDFAATNQHDILKITNDIVDKSQGVFLWVSIIAGLFEAGFQEGTSISDLQELVNNLPTKIADLFRYVWNRTGKRFRAEASEFFQVMDTCRKADIRLPALTAWFGSKDVPVDLEVSQVTETYLAGALRSLERKLMSRTGGLLELTPAGDRDMTRMSVDFMHRTAYDWVRANWASITSATDPEFDACLWITKGKCLSAILSPNLQDKSNITITSVTAWQDFFVLASRIPEDHRGSRVAVAAICQLNRNLVEGLTEKGWEWAAGDIPQYIGGKIHATLRELSDVEHFKLLLPPPTDLISRAVQYPIPVVVKNGLLAVPGAEPLLPGRYEEICRGVVFGELWFPAVETRLRLLDFLTSEKFEPWLSQLQTTLDLARVARRELSGKRDSGKAYLDEVITILESRLHQPQPQSGGPDSTKATVGAMVESQGLPVRPGSSRRDGPKATGGAVEKNQEATVPKKKKKGLFKSVGRLFGRK